jgi:ADP-ribose pyrophosphatase
MSNKKIPQHAELVFKGVLHDVYQWQQEMFDGSFATFEGIKRMDGLTILAITKGDMADKRILINYEQHPGTAAFITLPGGNTDDGEIKQAGVERELEEETGYRTDNWELWFTNDILKYKNMEWDNNFFIARDVEKTGEISLDSGEKIETKLVTFEKFLEIIQDERFRNKEITRLIQEMKGDVSKIEEFKQFLFL